jgi:hypothetical protein
MTSLITETRQFIELVKDPMYETQKYNNLATETTKCIQDQIAKNSLLQAAITELEPGF